MTQERLFLQHGMKRSGNHAISDWLVARTGSTRVNNLVPIGPVLDRGLPYPDSVSYAGFCSDRGLSGSVYVTLEDIDLDYRPFHGIGDPMTTVLVLRHPDNVFSSRIRKAFKTNMTAYPRANTPIMARAVRLWKQHAECYLGCSRLCPGRVAILFEAWLEDEAYRRSLCDRLGIEARLTGPETMSGFGGGSSFDGMTYAESPRKMDLRNRAARLRAEERALLHELYRDDELVALRAAVETMDPAALLSIA